MSEVGITAPTRLKFEVGQPNPGLPFSPDAVLA